MEAQRLMLDGAVGGGADVTVMELSSGNSPFYSRVDDNRTVCGGGG